MPDRITNLDSPIRQRDALRVAPGGSFTVSESFRTPSLVIEEGGELRAPSGHELTVTVDGIETGSALASTYAFRTVIVAGTYTGDVVVTVTEQNEVRGFGMVGATWPSAFHRQAAYVTEAGILPGKSVLAAVVGGELTGTFAEDVTVGSTGETFSAFHVAGGDFTLQRPVIAFEGNGRTDFLGYGAAVMTTGPNTRLVIDRGRIRTKGVMRPAVVATGGSNLIVKNSTLDVADGQLRPDYVDNMGPGMMNVPWMLGLSGNARAGVCLGDGTRVSYINSTVTAQRWGAISSDAVMSDDLTKRSLVTGINSVARITGEDGYGAFADRNADDRFYGTEFSGVTHGVIVGGGLLILDDSKPGIVARLNEELDLRLTVSELAALKSRPSRITSNRFGIMIHQFENSRVRIGGGTVIDSRETLFLIKETNAAISVDGSEGALLASSNGVLLQVMDTDDPVIAANDFSPQAPARVFTEPAEPAEAVAAWGLADVHEERDVVAAFRAIELSGDFFNGARLPRNLVLGFEGTRLRGVISASAVQHRVPVIGSVNYRELSTVTNTAQPPVNNGVIVTLDKGAEWVVTGTSYLTSLDIDAGARLRAGSLTVDGAERLVTPGSRYTGQIKLTAVSG